MPAVLTCPGRHICGGCVVCTTAPTVAVDLCQCGNALDGIDDDLCLRCGEAWRVLRPARRAWITAHYGRPN